MAVAGIGCYRSCGHTRLMRRCRHTAADASLARRRSWKILDTKLRQRRVPMPNPGQPTIGPGATGDAVQRAQRALRRTPALGLPIDGIFGPKTEAAVKNFQRAKGLTVDGIVGPHTKKALPEGGPMPTLQQGSTA